MSNKRKPKAKKAAARKVLDFDAIAAKKSTLLGELPYVRIGGKNRTLPPKIPLAVSDYFANAATEHEGKPDVRLLVEDMTRILAIMFGGQWEDISRHVSLEDVPVLFTEVFKAYGESVGESSASGDS